MAFKTAALGGDEKLCVLLTVKGEGGNEKSKMHVLNCEDSTYYEDTVWNSV